MSEHALQCDCDACLGPGEPMSLEAVVPFNMSAPLVQKRCRAVGLWCDMYAEANAAPSGKAPSTITVPKLHGDIAAFFVMPTELCKTTNMVAQLRTVGSWRIKKHKQAVWECMRSQCAPMKAPLGGRPMVLCCKFGGRRPDKYADFAKVAVDRLLPSRYRKTKSGMAATQGLGIIRDDSEVAIDIHQWWWPAKKADACVVIQVRTGV